MFRFFRYFIFLFLTVTVLPLLVVIGWDQFHFDQMTQYRQMEFLSFGAKNLQDGYARFIQDEKNHDRQIMDDLPQSLSLAQYQSLFDADKVVWRENAHFPQLPDHTTAIQGDYILYHNPQTHTDVPATVFNIPLKHGEHHGIWVVKTVPDSLLRPDGPFDSTIYRGNLATPSAVLQVIRDPGPHHPHGPGLMGYAPLPGKMPPRPPMGDCQSDMMEPSHPGSPSCDGPPPHDKDTHLLLSKPITIKNNHGETVFTIVIQSFPPPHQQELKQRSLWFAIFVLMTGLISSLLAGLYFQKNVIQPLIRVTVAAQKVEEGDLNAHINTSDIKQVDFLKMTENFNRMVVQLREKEQLRDNFIANLTHDLRIPLISQERTLVQLSQEFETLAMPEQSQLASSLAKNNEHLLNMVNQLLETYQFEAGQLRLAFIPVDVSALIYQCFDQLGPMATEYQILLNAELPSDFPTIQADRDSLKRVLINLIANAIENIAKGSTVTITGEVHQSDVVIHVRDNGNGIPEAHLDHLFDRYALGRDTRRIGSGLGLYICKFLIEAHHGQLSVQSELNAFTDFAIRLPIVQMTQTDLSS